MHTAYNYLTGLEMIKNYKAVTRTVVRVVTFPEK